MKDYRVEERYDEKGRIKTYAVYIGEGYIIDTSGKALNHMKLLALSVLASLVYIMALIPATNAARIIYVTVPLVVSALPIYFMVSASFLFYRKITLSQQIDKQTDDVILERKTAEKIANRLPAASIMTLILSGAALIALIVTTVITDTSFLPGDYIFLISALIISISSAAVFRDVCGIKAVIKP